MKVNTNVSVKYIYIYIYIISKRIFQYKLNRKHKCIEMNVHGIFSSKIDRDEYEIQTLTSLPP